MVYSIEISYLISTSFFWGWLISRVVKSYVSRFLEQKPCKNTLTLKVKAENTSYCDIKLSYH